MAPGDVIGNTRAMTAIPRPTRYSRTMGWHAPAMRRAVIVGSIGLIVAVLLLWFVPWGMAVMAGWDVAAVAFLTSVWPIILRADSSHAAELAMREDETRGSATALLVAASVASLLGVGFAITLARAASGPLQGATHRRRCANRRAVVDCGQHGLHPAVRRPALRIAGYGYRLRRRRRSRRGPHTATSPMSPSRSACATRCPTRQSAIAGFGVPCSPTPCCRICSASPSWEVRLISSQA